MATYSAAKDLLILAKLYHSQGRKVEAAQLAIKAMEEEDSEELFEALDDQNAQAAAEMEEAPEMENLTEEQLEMPESAEADADKCECEGEEEKEAALPPVSEAYAKVMTSKKVMANKMTLDGSRAARQKLIQKLRK